MRIGGRTIGLGFYGRIAELHNRLVRARYFRGHGVHSPFVYNIVREVFMRGELLPGDRRLYRALRVPEFPNAGRYSCKTWRFIAVTVRLA